MFLKRGEENEVPRCSFCGKTQDGVDTLISNPSDSRVFICNECIAVCNAVLQEHQKAKAASATVEARLKASVLEEHKKVQEAGATLAARLKALAARQ